MSHVSHTAWADALSGLARRVIGPAADRITFIAVDGPQRVCEYEASGGLLRIRASDGPAAAVGLHAYLRHGCGRQICWDTPLPLGLTELPDMRKTSHTPGVELGYYLNFCTFGYTAAFWDWQRWEREIDWMALHGITMPLALTGHEAALYDVYTDMGLDDGEVRRFLGGPAYLPWQFMGCLDGFAGPLPRRWIETHAELGAAIIAREQALGMTPVLPAFTGQVPRQLAGADTTARDWQGFTSYFLAPEDSRFHAVSSRLVQAQRRRLGTTHLYAADPFIEMAPPSGENSYLAALARTTLTGLRAADPQAVWVMQTWPFAYHAHYWTDERIAALLDAVPDDAMLLLDLWAEHTPQWTRFGGFRGKRWIWCTLHNFGGRADLVGNLPEARDAADRALRSNGAPDGVGLAMEASQTNHVLYELISEHPLEPDGDLDEQVSRLAARRYGAELPKLSRAWTNLLRSLYSAPPDRLAPQVFTGMLTACPHYDKTLDPKLARQRVDTARWYDPRLLVDAWHDLLSAAEAHPALATGPLGHDLVATAATAMARAIDEQYVATVTARARGADLTSTGSAFLEAFRDLDLLLETRAELRLETWEQAATSWASTAEERTLLLDNARRIVTTWTTPGHPPLEDYSARLWSGLVGDYYRGRWRIWLDGLGVASEGTGPPDETALQRRLADHTRAFLASGAGPARQTGNTLHEARRLYERYAARIAVDATTAAR